MLLAAVSGLKTGYAVRHLASQLRHFFIDFYVSVTVIYHLHCYFLTYCSQNDEGVNRYKAIKYRL